MISLHRYDWRMRFGKVQSPELGGLAGVYAIIIDTSVAYIGCTADFLQRFITHSSSLRNDSHQSKRLLFAFNNRQVSCEFVVLEVVPVPDVKRFYGLEMNKLYAAERVHMEKYSPSCNVTHMPLAHSRPIPTDMLEQVAGVLNLELTLQPRKQAHNTKTPNT